MWWRAIGIAGQGDDWTDADMGAAFGLLGLDFDYLVTAGDDKVSRLARRYCYSNKMHDRVKKVEALGDELLAGGGVLLYFGGPPIGLWLETVCDAGIPVVILPPTFRETLEAAWKNADNGG